MADDVKGWRFQEGYYECRERGYYYVSFHGLSTHAVPTTLVLRKNSEEVLAGYGSGTDYSTASNSGIVLLGLGDKLSLHVITGDIHESENSRRNYVTLSGFKVADSPGGPVGPPGAIGAAGSLGAGGAVRPVSPVGPVGVLGPGVGPIVGLGGYRSSLVPQRVALANRGRLIR
ncbi:uncharacterized protein LOC119099381 [Pollicipes pollicipes]|uniref:uncharacterized protein LOC119099381 n=1 Tax=Pollicipes pollicipes TaxID=41117 RepID=UPI001884F3F9|nr:uncharacterized protein LOC119099381 [Pollicipes pollicipes]